MLRGIVLYNLLTNGDLMGFYTNNHPSASGQLFWERAIVLSQSTQNHRLYDCTYEDNENGTINCLLEFRIDNGVYTARWILEGNTEPTFVGEGFLINEQIVISYRTV